MKNRYDKEIRVEVIDTIDRIGSESINLLSDDGFFTYGWFKTLEASKPFKIAPRYFAVYEKDRIIAVASSFIEYDFRYLKSLKDKTPLIKMAINIINRLGFSMNHPLICYSPSSWHSKILVGKNCQGKLILDLVSKKIDDLCKKEKIFVSSFFFVSEFERLLMENLQEFGYVKFPLMYNLYLDIQWPNFDNYLDSLENKVRKNVRREIKKCKECGVTIEEENEFGNLAITLSDLYSNLFSKYNKGAESPFGASFFRELSKYARDKTRVFIAKKNSKVVGFSLSLQHRDILDVYMCGFDYELLTKTDFTYFNVAYYAPIRLAIEEGVRRIHFRPATDRVKLKRGCKLERLYSFVKFHNKLLRPLVNLYVEKKYASQSSQTSAR